MDPYIGQIVAFGGNFAPRGWSTCDGTLLPIANYTALFSILGTMYGGDGRTTFGLPDLRGRSAVHAGNGPGLPAIAEGQKGGQTQFTLTANELPSHSHTATLHAESQVADANNPNGKMFGVGVDIYAAAQPTPDLALAAGSITVDNAGGGQPVTLRSPYQAVMFIIALEGVYPSRS